MMNLSLINLSVKFDLIPRFAAIFLIVGTSNETAVQWYVLF